jgi:hypothetical protein
VPAFAQGIQEAIYPHVGGLAFNHIFQARLMSLYTSALALFKGGCLFLIHEHLFQFVPSHAELPLGHWHSALVRGFEAWHYILGCGFRQHGLHRL